jgi:phosphate transport system ATP-binding protein
VTSVLNVFSESKGPAMTSEASVPEPVVPEPIPDAAPETPVRSPGQAAAPVPPSGQTESIWAQVVPPVPYVAAVASAQSAVRQSWAAPDPGVGPELAPPANPTPAKPDGVPPPVVAMSGDTMVLPAVLQAQARPAEPPAVPQQPRPGKHLAGLEAREISAWFSERQVLDRVSLHMRAGEVTALIGPSGCGKSTFLRILNRMHELIPSASLAGEVLLDGADLYDRERRLTDARRQVGMVFQKPNPFPAMSIYDNVVAGLKLTGVRADKDTKDGLVESCLAKAGLWKEVRDRLRSPGGALSGGQQQRLCIARSLAIQPQVLLMDEPCSALDPTSTRRIEQTIRELVDEVTIVIVTHNMQQAQRVSDRCAFFLAEANSPGVIVEHGPTRTMFGSPTDPRTFDYVNGRFG